MTKVKELPAHVTCKTLYNGEVFLEFNEKTHRYKTNGIWTPGVTSMLQRLNKGDALIQWASNMAVQAMLDGQPPEIAKYAHSKFKDDMANMGKRVHAWIEHFLKTGAIGMIDAEMKESVDGFLRWWRNQNVRKVQTERILYSREYHYCGTVDLILEIERPFDGKWLKVVADFKTGSPEREYRGGYTGMTRAYVEHFYQCALYDQAIYEEDGIQADAYAVLYLAKDGKMQWYINDRVDCFRQAAQSVIELHRRETIVHLNHHFDFINAI